ncbi:MAG: hypothetical protein GF330_00665 [Candidatus Eisenbacteria bacterium]|nr:hypothetical protein [Candidatus Eisenbacteria bacterium]
MRTLFTRRKRGDAWGMVPSDGEVRLVRASVGPRDVHVRPHRLSLESDGNVRRADRRLAGRAVVHPLADLSVRHERLNLPPMNASTLHRAVWQHCLSAQSDDAEIEVSYARSSEPGQQQDLLVVWARRAAVQEALERISELGFTAQRLTTPPVALSALLRQCGRPSSVAGSTVLVHIGQRIGSVGCHTDGKLVLAREFPVPQIGGAPADGSSVTGPAAESAEEARGQIIEEINRSILLFNHRLRGKRAARILISSEGADTSALARECAERFSLPVGRLIDELDIDLSGFAAMAQAPDAQQPPAAVDTEAPAVVGADAAAAPDADSADAADGIGGEERRLREVAQSWVLPIAAAVCGHAGEPDIDLLPAILALQQHRRIGIRIATGVALFGFLAMSMYHIPYFFSTSTIVHDLRAHASLAETTDRIVSDLADLRAARERADERLDFLAARQQPAAVAHTVLGALARAATDSLRIEEFELGVGHGDATQLELHVLGTIGSPSSALAQAQFNRFHERLRAEPYLNGADVGPLQIEARSDGSGSLLTFQLNARIATEGRQP